MKKTMIITRTHDESKVSIGEGEGGGHLGDVLLLDRKTLLIVTVDPIPNTLHIEQDLPSMTTQEDNVPVGSANSLTKLANNHNNCRITLPFSVLMICDPIDS